MKLWSISVLSKLMSVMKYEVGQATGVPETWIGSNYAYAYCHMCQVNGFVWPWVLVSRAVSTRGETIVASRHLSFRVIVNSSE